MDTSTPTHPIYVVIVLSLSAVALLAALASLVPPLWRRITDRVDRKVDRLLAGFDEVDQHFATAIKDRPWWEISPTCADLRAQWAEWEKELSS